jgi:hypothetical protein
MSVSLEGMTPEAIAELAIAAKGMLENPATRTRALTLYKEVKPDASIPEIDLPHQFNAALAEERQKREALENRMREDDVRRDIEAKRAAMVSKGIPSDKVVEVEKLMTERGIMNHDTAADFYLSQQKLATPTSPDIGSRFHSQGLPVIDAAPFGGSIKNWAKAQAMAQLERNPLRH